MTARDIGPDLEIYYLEFDYYNQAHVDFLMRELEIEEIDNNLVLNYSFLAQKFLDDPARAAERLQTILNYNAVDSELVFHNQHIRIPKTQYNDVLELNLADNTCIFLMSFPYRGTLLRYLRRHNTI